MMTEPTTVPLGIHLPSATKVKINDVIEDLVWLQTATSSAWGEDRWQPRKSTRTALDKMIAQLQIERLRIAGAKEPS